MDPVFTGNGSIGHVVLGPRGVPVARKAEREARSYAAYVAEMRRRQHQRKVIRFCLFTCAIFWALLITTVVVPFVTQKAIPSEQVEYPFRMHCYLPGTFVPPGTFQHPDACAEAVNPLWTYQI